MKKLIGKILLVISIFLIPWDTFAAGGYSVSRTNISMTKGGTSSFNITASNAAGRVNVVSSNSAVASVSAGAVFLDCSSATITVTGKSAGSAVITVSPYDFATFDEEVVTNSYKIYVTVTEPVSPSPGTGGNTGGGTVVTDTRSNNTNLKSLTIDGKEVSKKDGNYFLEVSNYVSSIKLDALAQDNKSKVSGVGAKELNVGENIFNVSVTAENGRVTTYKVVVARKEYNSLNELDNLLVLNKDVEIKLEKDDKLSKEDLNKIIKNKKKITFNQVSSDNKIIYSWVLDGSSIKSVESFNPILSLEINNNEKMEEALNYADGIYLDFSNCLDIPKGAILRYYVGDKYKDGDKINLYIYDEVNNTITQLESDLVTKDGYIELKISDSVKHFMSKAKVLNAKSSEVNIWFIVSIVLSCIIVIGFIYILVSKKSRKVKVEPVVEEVMPTPKKKESLPTNPVDKAVIYEKLKERIVEKSNEAAQQNDVVAEMEEKPTLEENTVTTTDIDTDDEIL